MTSDSVGSEVVKTLDQLAIRYLILMNETLKLRKQLEEAMKEGFIQMAKARYVMGNRRVSLVQIDEDKLKATVRIERQEMDATGPVKSWRFVLCDADDQEKSDEYGNSHVRHRDKGRSTTEQQTADSTKKHTTSANNVLKLFGVLTPSSLKLCQREFSKAVELTVEIATAEHELQMTVEAFKSKLKDKTIIKEQNEP